MLADTPLGNRVWLRLSIAALLGLAAAVSAISMRDPEAMWLRFGMIFMTVGAAMWLPLPAVLITVPLVWLGPNFARGYITDEGVLRRETLLELPGLIGLAVAALLTRYHILMLEKESEALNGYVGLQSELDEDTGVYQERLLAESIERELVRSRRFGREFALMLAAIDPLRVKFEYRDDEKWYAGVKATANVLLNTRTNIDRVYRYGDRGFALLLPETGVKDISGLARRLARTAKKASPAQGEPGGPLPLHFGVTFFPQCATTVENLLRRAEVALRLAEKNPSRLQLDGAEAPDMISPELLRLGEDEEAAPVEALAERWLGAEAPEEEHGAWLSAPASVTVEYAEPALEEAVPEGVSGFEEAAFVEEASQLREEAGSVETSEQPLAKESVLVDGEPLAAHDELVSSIDDAALVPEGVVTSGTAGSVIEPRMQEAVSDLARRLDETLEMIRALKAKRAA